mgnify:FL=1
MRIKSTILFIFLCFFHILSSGQPFVEEEDLLSDSIAVKEAYPYWEKDFYADIPAQHVRLNVDSSAFAAVKEKYKGTEFIYRENRLKAISLWERILNRIHHLFLQITPDYTNKDFTETLLYILAGIGLVVLLYLLKKLLIDGNRLWVKAPKEEEETTEISFVEQNLMDIDLSVYIARAAQQGNYPLAIRYHNLLNIQLLAKQGLLQWRPSKSNAELLADITDLQVRSAFGSCLSIFDRVWFSGVILSADQYKEYVNVFEEFQRARR